MALISQVILKDHPCRDQQPIVTVDEPRSNAILPNLHNGQRREEAALEPLKALPLWNVPFSMECTFSNLFQILIRMCN